MTLPRIEACLKGKMAFLGIGNTDLGDDGFGVFLARELKAAGVRDAIDCGTVPEKWVAEVASRDFDHIVFLDAVLAGQTPGTVVFMDAEEIKTRFPQISTHKISLGILADLILRQSSSRVWLIGVQPKSVEENALLSDEVSQSLACLANLLAALAPQELSC
jgi:hydrogenase maturation protease